MSRNPDCKCPCHGDKYGNRVGDQYFSCKNCYAAYHMGNLPRQSWDDVPRPKIAKKDRKPRVTRPTGTVEAVAAAVKVIAKEIMNDLADAAEMVVAERTSTEKRFDLGHRLEKKDGESVQP